MGCKPQKSALARWSVVVRRRQLTVTDVQDSQHSTALAGSSIFLTSLTETRRYSRPAKMLREVMPPLESAIEQHRPGDKARTTGEDSRGQKRKRVSED